MPECLDSTGIGDQILNQALPDHWAGDMLEKGTRFGPYTVLASVGAGGMGEVYRALDTRLGRQVAVKILPEAVANDPRRVARFETEARALAALSHPNILGIHDFGRSDGRLYVVTELLNGETLRERMSGEPMAWRKAVEIAAGIADGLASAHASGIVHRDLKPENVFLTADGRVKILDFGLAKVVEPVSGDAVTLTSPSGGAVSGRGQVVGTLAYMAPEQLRGFRVDGRSDVFALGCVLYEMLSGQRPFPVVTPADTIAAILHAEPVLLDGAFREIPPSVSRDRSPVPREAAGGPVRHGARSRARAPEHLFGSTSGPDLAGGPAPSTPALARGGPGRRRGARSRRDPSRLAAIFRAKRLRGGKRGLSGGLRARRAGKPSRPFHGMERSSPTAQTRREAPRSGSSNPREASRFG